MASSDKNSSGLDGDSGWGGSNSSQGWGGGGGGTDNDRGDNTPSYPGGPRPTAGNPSYAGGQYGGSWGGWGAQTSISASRSYTAPEKQPSAWDNMLSRLSAAVTNPKNIGKAVGFLLGGPQFFAVTTPVGGWLADKMFGDPKTQAKAPERAQTRSLASPAWGGMFSGKAISPEREMSQGSESAYQSWQVKMNQRGTQQAAWQSYLAGLSQKKTSSSSSDEWGLLG